MDWDTLASVATAFGVALAAWQLRESAKMAQCTFEDSLDQQYRMLARDIPVDALIGEAVKESDRPLTRELIYNYLDLCNEQVYLRKKRRVSKETWLDWCSGIKANLEKVAFVEVWDEVKEKSPECFSFLEGLEKAKFEIDPKSWK